MKLRTVFLLSLASRKVCSQTGEQQGSFVDSSTPEAARTVRGMGDRKLTLVFSDEFSDAGRSFDDGHDTRWTAEERPAEVNAALHYYNSSRVKTNSQGQLVIETVREDANWVERGQNYFERPYQSGMVTTWNKFCFTSGMIEISVQLPGSAKRGGLWPAFWMLGNLARPSYLRSTDGIWPWSYDQCGTSQESVEANSVQELSNCRNGKGRGSPEIDIIEAQPGDFTLDYPSVPFVDGVDRPLKIQRPMISSSLQLSPGISRDIRPYTPDFPREGQWYPDLFPLGGKAYGDRIVETAHLGDDTIHNKTGVPRMINNYWYGQVINENPQVWQDGLSCNWHHDISLYREQTIIRTEWQAGKDDGYIRFFYGDELFYEITADMLKRKPGEADAIPQIPYEAMYLILNTDISPRWGWNGCLPQDSCMQANPGMCSAAGELLCQDCADPQCLLCPETTGWLVDFCNEIDPRRPAQYKIDYVRVYQDENDPTHHVTCDPEDYPTKDFIDREWHRYTFDPTTLGGTQTAPLLPIQHGGGDCNSNRDCGNLVTDLPAGTDIAQYLKDVNGVVREAFCVQGKCQCPDHKWTGPHCMSPCLGDLAGCVQGSGSDGSAASMVTSPSFAFSFAAFAFCFVL